MQELNHCTDQVEHSQFQANKKEFRKNGCN